LLDGQDSVLASMSEKAQQYTFNQLGKLNVKIVLNMLVTDFKDGVVHLSDGSKIESENLIWASMVISNSPFGP